MAAAQYVKVEMKHRLTGIASGIRDDPIPGVDKPLLFRDVGTGDQQLGQEIPVLVATVLHR